VIVHPDPGQGCAGRGNPPAFVSFGSRPAASERLRIGLEGDPPSDDLGALRGLGHSGYVHCQGKPVEQLGAELAFFGVHRADQHKGSRVAERDALAFDGVDAHRGGVQQRIDQVIRQQVHLIHVQQAAIGAGE
jgi:hypothetical protein